VCCVTTTTPACTCRQRWEVPSKGFTQQRLLDTARGIRLLTSNHPSTLYTAHAIPHHTHLSLRTATPEKMPPPTHSRHASTSSSALHRLAPSLHGSKPPYSSHTALPHLHRIAPHQVVAATHTRARSTRVYTALHRSSGPTGTKGI
jgi:hypothetical protein